MGRNQYLYAIKNRVFEKQAFSNWDFFTFVFFFFSLVQTLESCYNVRLFVYSWQRFGRVGLHKQWCQAWLSGLGSLCWHIHFIRLKTSWSTAFFFVLVWNIFVAIRSVNYTIKLFNRRLFSKKCIVSQGLIKKV